MKKKSLYFSLSMMTLLLVCSRKTVAQQTEAPFSPWLMPGGSHNFSKSVTGLLQVGRNPQQDLYISYGQVFIKINKYISLNPAHMFIKTSPANGIHRDESTFLNSIIFSVPVHQLTIEDRNLIWNRFIRHFQDQYLYRNRLKIIRNTSLEDRNIKVYIFDEATYHINKNSWSRNRLGIGASFDALDWLNADVSYARQHDRSSGKLNLAFVMITVTF